MKNYKNLKQSHKYYIQILVPLLLFLLFVFLFYELEIYHEAYGEWVNDSPLKRFLVSGTMVLLVIFIIQYWYSVTYGKGRIKRILAQHQIKPLENCQSGEVAIFTGLATIAESAEVAPYTNKECIGYKITAQHQVDVTTRAGSPRFIWEDINKLSSYSNFLLCDGRRFAYVLTEGAELLKQEDVVFSKCESEEYSDDSKQKARAVLKDMGILFRSSFIAHDKGLRFLEARFDIDEELLVCGEGNWESVTNYPELDVLKNKGVNKVYVVKSQGDFPLIISDSVEGLSSSFK